MKTVSFEALIELQAKTIKVHGGLPGIKDVSLIKGALERPSISSLMSRRRHPGGLRRPFVMVSPEGTASTMATSGQPSSLSISN
jgi:hypothetical protein